MSGHSQWENRGPDDRVAKNADQTEYNALCYGASNLDAGTFDDRIAESLDDYEISDPLTVLPWTSRDQAIENAASDIVRELMRRLKMLGGSYPFKIEGSRLVYSPSKTRTYEFCLAVSQSPSLVKGDYARLPIAFERLTRDVLVCFLGPRSVGLRTGWPADSHENRPRRFRDLIKIIHDQTGEWPWAPEPGFPDDPSYVKEEGLDVIVWKEIHDERPGRLFLVGQCACGDDFENKYHEIDARFTKFQRWLRPMPCVEPVRVFSIPRHIANDIDFRDANRRAGLFLDRTRLVLMAEEHAEYIRDNAKIPYDDLIRIVINSFQAAEPIQ